MEKITEAGWEAQYARYARATYDDLLRVGQNILQHLPAVLHMKNGSADPQTLFKMAVTVMILSGSAGCANGRPVNDSEKRLFRDLLGSLFNGFPAGKSDAFADRMAESFSEKLAPQTKKMIEEFGPLMASVFLDLSLCFAFADGEVEENDRASLSTLLELVNGYLTGQNA